MSAMQSSATIFKCAKRVPVKPSSGRGWPRRGRVMVSLCEKNAENSAA